MLMKHLSFPRETVLRIPGRLVNLQWFAWAMPGIAGNISIYVDLRFNAMCSIINSPNLMPDGLLATDHPI
jgi:hypothetical protein